MITQKNRLTIIFLSIAILLLIVFVAMQFSDEVDWSPFDFMVMGILLTGTGLSMELVLRKVSKFKHRLVLCGILLILFFVAWAELAVGIFGIPFAGS